MPDTTELNIINLNIDSIQAEIMSGKTNRGEETHTIAEDCTDRNTAGVIKQDANSKNGKNQSNKSINYFYSTENTEVDRRKSDVMTQNIHNTFGDVFNGIGCFKGTFSLQLKPNSKPYQLQPRHVAYMLQNCSRRNWSNGHHNTLGVH